METIRRGEWVRIHTIVLTPDQRAPHLPEETGRVPLEMWVKGALLDEGAAIGDSVAVRTVTGRIVRGRLETVHPAYDHSFGAFVPELHAIRLELRDLTADGKGEGR